MEEKLMEIKKGLNQEWVMKTRERNKRERKG